MPVTLTQPTLKNYAASAVKAAKRIEISDAVVPGLWLVNQPSGAQSWAVRYRAADRTSRKLTLGALSNVLDLKTARERARDELRAIGQGLDPARSKKLARDTGTPADDTLAAHVHLFREKHVSGLRASTASYTNMVLEAMQDEFTGRTLDSLKKSELVHFIDVPKGAASKVLRWKVTKCFLRWCANRSDDYVSPLAGYPKPAEELSRDRVLDDAELRTLWRAAVDVGGVAGRLARLLVLTGARRSEIMRLERSELSKDAINLPATRTKNGVPHSITITAAMRDVLGECPKDGRFVLSGSDKAPGDHSGLKARLPELGGHWTFHDLRRTCATGMQRIGILPHIIELALNHRSGVFRGVAGTYQRHGHEAEVADAFERWSRHVASLVSEKAAA